MQPQPGSTSADAALVVAAQGGDMAAFEALYRKYFGAVYDFAVRTMKDSHSAADAVQDAFIKAHDKIGQLRDPDAFRPWLYAIVRREALGAFRTQVRETVIPAIEYDGAATNPLLSRVDDDLAANPSAAAELSDSAALVWEAAASLDTDTYTVLDLHVRQGLSSAEIADVLGISKGNAYTKLNRMKERTGVAISTYLLIRKGSKECDELSLIVAGVDLPPVTETLRKRVDRHARSCDECSKRRKALVAPMSIFAALAAVPPPAGLEEAIWANVSSTPPAGGSSRLGRRSLGVLAVIGAFVLLLGLGAIVGAVVRDSGPVLAAPDGTATLVAEPVETAASTVSPTGSATSAPVESDDAAAAGVDEDEGLDPTPSPVVSGTAATQAAPDTTVPDPAPTAASGTTQPTTPPVATVTTSATLPAPPSPTTPPVATAPTSATLPAPPPPTTPETTLATLPAPPPPPPPDASAPVIAQPTASPGQIWELDSNVIACPVGTSRLSRVSAVITDAGSGVGDVTASWVLGGSTSSSQMTLIAGAYTVDFGPFQAGTVPEGTTSPVITISIVAVDGEGNTSRATTAVTLNSIAKCFG